jgi:hypothetical protein
MATLITDAVLIMLILFGTSWGIATLLGGIVKAIQTSQVRKF